MPPPRGNKTEPRPSGGDKNIEMPVRGNAVQQPSPTPQQAYSQHPAVKFTPPVKAKDEMYDVHPPLNTKASQPSKQEEHHSDTPAKKDSHPAPPPKEKESKPPHGGR
jgi:hypothetical protein